MESSQRVHPVALPSSAVGRVLSWSVSPGDQVRKGSLLCAYTHSPRRDNEEGGTEEDGRDGGEEVELQLKSTLMGVVKEILVQPEDIIQPGTPIILLEESCDHSIIVFDMCADCGLNLRKHTNVRAKCPEPDLAHIRMIHGIPGIRLSAKEAQQLGRQDRLRLLKSRRLALVVDLDQTLIHTSIDPNIRPGLPDVYGFNLPGHHMVYHCRLRPHVRDFLQKVHQYYELHVFTMGTKSYAASVTHILDPEKRLFSDRIISRDEFFDPHSKALRLKSVFPCGDSMVAIIDDREDVWGRCPNLVHVKPYVFFAGTADINAPPQHTATSTPVTPTPTTPHTLTTPHTPTTPPPSSFPHSQQDAQVDAQQSSNIQANLQKSNSPDTSIGSSAIEGSSNSPNMSPHCPLTPLETLLLSKGDADETTLNANTKESSLEALENERPSAEETRGASQEEGPGEAVSSTVDVVQHTGSEPVPHGNGNSNANNDNSEAGSGDARCEVQQHGGDGLGEQESRDRKESSSSSSSSSSSDSEDDSSTSSSSIDDSLLDRLGEGVEEEGNKEEGEEGGEKMELGRENTIDEPKAEEETTKEQEEEKMDTTTPETTLRENLPSQTSQTDPIPPTNHQEQPELGKQSLCGTDDSKQVADAEHSSTTFKKPNPSHKRRTSQIHDPDNFLLYLGDTLKQLHTTFYLQFDEMSKDCDMSSSTDIPTPDLKKIIPQMRQSVLKGVNILFTGVIPTNIPLERSPEWNTARAFGATVHGRLILGLSSANRKEVLKATTHVVVGKPGTSKFKEARKIPGIKIVNPRWLWCCAERWQLADEREFPIDFGQADEGKRRDSSHRQPKRKIARMSHYDKFQQHSSDSVAAVITEKELDHGRRPANARSSCKENGRNFGKGEAKSKHLDTVRRFTSVESRLSVSDEEFDRMEAEVDAEISSSSSSSEKEEREVDKKNDEDLGSFVQEPGQEGDSYDEFVGVTPTRKRKHDDAEDSSSNSSSPDHISHLNPESAIQSDDSDSEDDELAVFLEGGVLSGAEADSESD